MFSNHRVLQLSQAFVNAKSRDEIVFTRGATEAINLVAYSWGMKELKAGDEIILTVMEHHSNLVPWQIIAQRTGAVLKVSTSWTTMMMMMIIYWREQFITLRPNTFMHCTVRGS